MPSQSIPHFFRASIIVSIRPSLISALSPPPAGAPDHAELLARLTQNAEDAPDALAARLTAFAAQFPAMRALFTAQEQAIDAARDTALVRADVR